MSRTSTTGLAEQLRDILLELRESKESQFVGNSQIIVKEFTSDAISVTSETSGYMSNAYASCTATAPTIADGNILITYCVPEVRVNGTLIDNKNAAEYTCHTSIIETSSDNTNGYQVSIYHSSIEGEDIPVETYSVVFHIYSAAEVTLTATGGVYG